MASKPCVDQLALLTETGQLVRTLVQKGPRSDKGGTHNKHRPVFDEDGNPMLRYRKGVGWVPRKRQCDVDLDKPCSYQAAHIRITAFRGPASEHVCVDCGGHAQHWAYDGTDPDELSGRCNKGYLRSWSRYPDFYTPLCMDCHRQRDAGWRAERNKEFEAFLKWKQEATA